MMFDFKVIENTPEILAIEMKGNLNTIAANNLKTEIDLLEKDLNKPVLIDVSQLDYISSTGLRCFLAIKKTISVHGQKVTLKGMTNNVASVFQMTGFDKMFDQI